MGFLRNIAHHVFPMRGNAYRPHLLRDRWLLFFLCGALVAEGFLAGNLFLRQEVPELLSAVIGSEIVFLTNDERAALGAPRLLSSKLLEAAAQNKAEDMAARGYFAHATPEGKGPWTWLKEAGYEYRYAGENLAVRFVDSRDAVKAWMDSPSHRANIAKPQYTSIGVGVAQGFYEGRPATYVVQYFAAPPAAYGEGAAVAQSRQFTDAFVRQFVRLAAEPREVAATALGAVAALLSLLIASVFLRKTEIQPVPMLLSGALVFFIALSLFGINGVLLAPGGAGYDQASFALRSMSVGEVVVGKGISDIAPNLTGVYR